MHTADGAGPAPGRLEDFHLQVADRSTTSNQLVLSHKRAMPGTPKRKPRQWWAGLQFGKRFDRETVPVGRSRGCAAMVAQFNEQGVNGEPPDWQLNLAQCAATIVDLDQTEESPAR